MIVIVYHFMNGAKVLVETSDDESDLAELIDQVGKLLAEEYLNLMKKGAKDESSDLCKVLEREPETREH